MRVSVTDAKAQLTELVRRAEAGEEVILTRHGQPAVRLVVIERKKLTPEERRKVIDDFVASIPDTVRATWTTDAAHSQDFLYDEKGLPA